MIDIILGQLISNQEYFGKVWPYLKEEYFDKGPARILYNSIKKHVDAYHGVPSKVVLDLVVNNSSLNEVDFNGTTTLLNNLKTEKESIDWLVPETEAFIKKRAIYNATVKIVQIQNNADKPINQRDKRLPDVGAIPDIMKEALAVCFDSSIGHNWMDDYESRWLSYQNKARKIPFKLSILGKITKGGVEIGTLNIILAGVNVGKSLGLCSLTADYLQSGKNVLYISMEMAEEVVAKRIDANLLDISMDDLDDGHVSYPEYKARMERWRRANVLGQLYIKQYPIGGAHALTFKALLNELKLKKGFKPDVIVVDYLGICASSRIKVFSENSYTLVKAIAEELRALAVEEGVPIWTAAQTTRGGWDNSDITMSDIAESAGLSHTADFILAAIETEELAAQGVQLMKQIKSRYGDKSINNKFTLCVKKGNQRWYEADGPSAPVIPDEMMTDDIIIKACVDAKENIPITEESIKLSNREELEKVHRISAASRSELEDLAAQLNF
ncbi:replication and recombination DNA helicase [Acinetobacter phage vB_AbaM_Lazarus]|uniref:DnaB-like replicative helicase n=1 Tax=Acinetobacter phage vB_AbaM_Lazarus TaxID=2686289 RepID=A0A6B9SUD4_9CAUD|nr:replication and recombination DNA helicase [Acinetobacter phage vB_AbaM_Lazarus]QHJ74006.1 replication and recombination DNA helicase [Acinetobacter phage vB_AbaM_Lazarus]